MSLELMREPIKISQSVGEEIAQTVIENDIIVPDVKPDINKILLFDGDIYVSNAEVEQDKVALNGQIQFRIIYMADDERRSVKGINASAAFAHGFGMVNISPGMKCRVKCEIEHMEYNLLNSRKVNVKSIVKVYCKVSDEVEKHVVYDVGGLDDIQTLKDNITVNCYEGENKANAVIQEKLEIPSSKPSIKEILRNDIRITGKEYKISDNKIIAKGDVNITTLYIGDDEGQNIQSMEHEIPFTQFIDLPGINDGTMCDVRFQIEDYRFEPEEDSDGELRVLNSEVSVDIFASAYGKRNIEIIADAYSPGVRINLEKQVFKLEDIFADNKSQVVLKDAIAIKGDIAEVFNVLSKPNLSECRIFEDKVVIEGVVNNSILYLANSSEQPIHSHIQEIPFRQNIDLKGIKPDMGYEIDLETEHCNYSMVSDTEVEVRLVITVYLKIINQVSIPLIVKASEENLEDKRGNNQPSLILYFIQPGDTLWAVAKKYFTTVADIQRVNNLDEADHLSVGQQLIIPKRI